jgi:hypothetical protein
VDPIIKDRDDVLKTELDVARFIISANLSRRQLSASVKASLGAELVQRIVALDSGKSKKAAIQEAAKATGSSESYVKQAAQVQEKDPERFKEVKEGKKSVAKAGKEIRAEAGEDADEAAVIRKCEKVVEKAQQKLGEFGYRLVDDTIEPLD